MGAARRYAARFGGVVACLVLLPACQTEVAKGPGREAALKDAAVDPAAVPVKEQVPTVPPKPGKVRKSKVALDKPAKAVSEMPTKAVSEKPTETWPAVRPAEPVSAKTAPGGSGPPDEGPAAVPASPTEAVPEKPAWGTEEGAPSAGNPTPRPVEAGPACFPCTLGEVPGADVVVALGVRPAGTYTPSPGMISNLLTAVAILNSGKADYLMVCGGYTRGHIAEAEMMAIIAQGLGVPLARILVENGSVDTEENARNAALLARSKGLGSAILVAQKSHIERATNLFRQAEAFTVLHSVVGLELSPEFRMADMGAGVPEGKFDAIVVHGVSPGYVFRSDPLAVDAQLPALLAAASGLYRQHKVPLILWHPICPHGHIPRTEIMAILLAAMGVPEKSMVLGSARRYEASGLDIPKLCKGMGAQRVLALLPPDDLFASVRSEGRFKSRDLGGPGSAREAEDMYRKAGIEAVPVFLEKE